MATEVCVGDCLYVDNDGLLQIRVDNETVVCEDDGTGNTVLKSFGNKGFTDWDLDYDCPIGYGQKVYCEADTTNLWTQKEYKECGVGGDFSSIPNINQLLAGNGTPIREVKKTLTNNDPCGRDLCVQVHYNWNTYQVDIPGGGTGFQLNAEVCDPDNPGQWINVSSSGFCNYGPDMMGYNPGSTTYDLCFGIPRNSSIDIGMRWITAPEPTKHTPGAAWDVSPTGIYGDYMRWEISSNCEDCGCAFESLGNGNPTEGTGGLPTGPPLQGGSGPR